MWKRRRHILAGTAMHAVVARMRADLLVAARAGPWPMHISEGILPPDWAGLWFLVAAPFVFWGLRTIHRRRGRRSALHGPGGDGRRGDLRDLLHARAHSRIGSCSHPCGTGLGALLIGPGPTVVVASIALLFQALFLAHGGLTTLGANIVSMGVVGAFTAYRRVPLAARRQVPVAGGGVPGRRALRLGHLRHDLAGIGQRAARRRLDGGHVRHRDAGLRSHAASAGHCRRSADGRGLPLRLGPPARAVASPTSGETDDGRTSMRNRWSIVVSADVARGLLLPCGQRRCGCCTAGGRGWQYNCQPQRQTQPPQRQTQPPQRQTQPPQPQMCHPNLSRSVPLEGRG